MTSALRPRTLVLFVGDLLFFTLSLWLSLWLRTFEVPSYATFMAHLAPFSLLFVAWVVVFFIAGLYESRLLHYARRELTSTLLYAQVFNIVIATAFFFLVPLFGIAPKTLLIIYAIVSFVLVLLWRVYLYSLLGLRKEVALVVGEGEEISDLVAALCDARSAPVAIAEVIAPQGDVAAALSLAVERHDPSFVIAHWQDPRVSGAFSGLVNYLRVGVRFVDAMGLYEEVFGRVPLSVLNEQWLARNVSRYAHTLYDPLKRLIDIAAGLALSLVLAVIYPVFVLIIKLQDGGPVFYRQVRVGQSNTPFVMYKFRSMSGTDQGAEVLKSKHVVTPFGRVMRVTRLDEFPQVWNLLKGDLSLIGPRPEFPALVEEYARAIPYYNVRHLVKPGLSGWAQLYHDNHPHHGANVEATREKLSYDLYYLKHRSLVLDGSVALKTVKKLLTRSGV